MSKSVPFVGSALLVATAGITLKRLLDGNPQKGEEVLNPDALIFAGSLISLIVLGVMMHQKGPFTTIGSGRPSLSTVGVSMASTPFGAPVRTNQEIFEAAIARSRQGPKSSVWHFNMVDALLQEGARSQTVVQGRTVQKIVIDMRGVDGSKLKLQHVDFAKEGYEIDFTGANFDKLDLEECKFAGCLFDDVKMRGIDVSVSEFTRCRFGNGTIINGEIRGKVVPKQLSLWNQPLGLNDELIEDEAELVTTLYSCFDRCEFGRAYLDETMMKYVKFTGSRFRNTFMRWCELVEVHFEGVASPKQGPDLIGVIFDHSSFRKGSMTNILMVESSLRGCEFHQFKFTNFEGVGVIFDPFPQTTEHWQTCFTECTIGGGTKMSGCSLKEVELVNCHLKGTNPTAPLLFDNCNLTGSKFIVDMDGDASKTWITGCIFRRCTMTRVYFDPGYQLGYNYKPGATLDERLVFDSCDLTESVFRKIVDGKIIGARMEGDRVAFLGWNNFTRARWEGVKMADIYGNDQLRWASNIEGDFTGTHLEGADLFNRLFGASIFDATHLEGAGCQRARFRQARRLHKAIVNRHTQLSRALLPKYARYSPIGKIAAKQGALFFN